MELEHHSGSDRERQREISSAPSGTFHVLRTTVDGTDSWIANHANPVIMLKELFFDSHGRCVTSVPPGRYFAYRDTACSHHKYWVPEGANLTPVAVLSTEAHRTFLTTPIDGFKVSTPHWTQLDELLPFPPDELYEDLLRDAMRQFMQQMPVEVDGLNFVGELRKLHELIPRVADSIGKTIASGFLNWNFGWAPFLNDLKAIAKITGTVQKRLQWLRDTWGKTTKLTAVRKDFYQPPALPFWGECGVSPFVSRFYREYYSCTFRAGAWLTHWLDNLNEKLTEIRALALALGVGNPLGAIWEAVPFSFVLDWLSSATSVFDETAINHITSGEWRVRRPTYSVSVAGRIRLGQYTRWNYLVGWDHLTVKPVTTVRVSHYKRWSGIPEAPSLFELGSLSPKRASLLLAIAASGNWH